jgi:hypothetical protein
MELAKPHGSNLGKKKKKPTKLKSRIRGSLFSGRLVQNCTQNQFKEDYSFPDS